MANIGVEGQSKPVSVVYNFDNPYAAARVFGIFALRQDPADLAEFDDAFDLNARATSIFVKNNGRELDDPANEPVRMERAHGPALNIWADSVCLAIGGIAHRRHRLTKPMGKPLGLWASMDSLVLPFVGDRQPRSMRTLWRGGIIGAKRDQIVGAKRTSLDELAKAEEAFNNSFFDRES